jgi:FkbM family methyltransferase
MHRYSWLIKYPELYAYLLSWQKCINYEKLLYLKKIKKDDVVFDIGANVGYFTTLFSKLCGVNGKIHSFEPVPSTFQKLLDSTKCLMNVIANNKAVGNSNELVDIYYNQNDCEKATLLKPDETYLEKAKIHLITLDSYFYKNKLKRLDFVKCDVESFEFHAINGFRNTLLKHKPKLSIEVTISNEERSRLFELLLGLGYKNFKKIQKGFPVIDVNNIANLDKDFFYLYATS